MTAACETECWTHRSVSLTAHPGFLLSSYLLPRLLTSSNCRQALSSVICLLASHFQPEHIGSAQWNIRFLLACHHAPHNATLSPLTWFADNTCLLSARGLGVSRGQRFHLTHNVLPDTAVPAVWQPLVGGWGWEFTDD